MVETLKAIGTAHFEESKQWLEQQKYLLIRDTCGQCYKTFFLSQ
jgi:hypothetical protein